MPALSPYLHIRRIEFIVTWHCSGRCIHCSAGQEVEHPTRDHCLSPQIAADAVEFLCRHFPVESVMTFGGEPLLYPEVTCAIHQTASDCGVGKRQVITNGFFSRDEQRIRQVAAMLKKAGANDILLSVDAFHQQRIPLEYPYAFAKALLENDVSSLRLSPAWLVNRDFVHPFNTRTREILSAFESLHVPTGQGNDIFLAGNAAKNLSQYYDKQPPDLSLPCGAMPYTEPVTDVSCLSIEPNGNVVVCHFVIGNLLQQPLEEIIARYDPYAQPCMAAVARGGVQALLQLAHEKGIPFSTDECCSACDVCRKLSARIENA